MQRPCARRGLWQKLRHPGFLGQGTSGPRGVWETHTLSRGEQGLRRAQRAGGQDGRTPRGRSVWLGR